MEIFLPKENKDSETGGPKEWEAISHTSSTQKEAIASFEKYISKLSERLKEVDKDVSEKEKRNTLLEEKMKEIEKVSGWTFNLVVAGWLGLLFVVIGIIFGYYQFIKDSVKNDDLKFGITQKINEQEKELEKLKICLSASKWLNPKCLE